LRAFFYVHGWDGISQGAKDGGAIVTWNNDMNTCKQIFVSGLVQGVFFRDSTRQKANQLNLSGMVRNLRDGRVEVQVAGDEVIVQTLIKWLENGPKYAKVSTIEVIDLSVNSSPDQHGTSFEIWATR
jgi:acylphosphatase